eukprot:scaffold13392_cov71-Phaeocystis_antarctica.AAC.1
MPARGRRAARRRSAPRHSAGATGSRTAHPRPHPARAAVRAAAPAGRRGPPGAAPPPPSGLGRLSDAICAPQIASSPSSGGASSCSSPCLPCGPRGGVAIVCRCGPNSKSLQPRRPGVPMKEASRSAARIAACPPGVAADSAAAAAPQPPSPPPAPPPSPWASPASGATLLELWGTAAAHRLTSAPVIPSPPRHTQRSAGRCGSGLPATARDDHSAGVLHTW